MTTFPTIINEEGIETQKSHRISTRFTTTLKINVFKALLTFGSSLMLAKGLGPASYGDLNFLLTSFLSLRALMDMGSSSAFYTFTAQSKRSKQFYLSYLFWLGLQVAVVLLVVGVFIPTPLLHWLWVGQKRALVVLAFLASFFSNALWRYIETIGEARRETLFTQKIRMFLAILHLFFIGISFYWRWLTVPLVLSIIVLEFGVGSILFACRFNWKEALWDDEKSSPKILLSQYVVYCKPLVWTSCIAFFAGYIDRWLLQHYGGSIQQGFFSVGQQFSTISLLGTTSIINIFWQEVASLHSEGNTTLLHELYSNALRSLYFAAAAFSCFAMVFSQEILTFFYGSNYTGATFALAVFLLYPIHQTLGQINGSFLMATHKTGRVFFFTLLSCLLSFPLSYILLAPKSALIPGLNLAALGLSLSQVIVNFISVNLQGMDICRERKWKWPFFEQMAVLSGLLVIAYLSRYISNLIFSPLSFQYILFFKVILAGLFYLLGLFLIAYFKPSLIALEIGWFARLKT